MQLILRTSNSSHYLNIKILFENNKTFSSKGLWWKERRKYLYTVKFEYISIFNFRELTDI